MQLQEINEKYFKNIPDIKYEGPQSKNVFAFKYYNPDEVIPGVNKTMSEILRFSVCYWHTFRGTGIDNFGSETINRPWESGKEDLENAKRRMMVNFAFLKKLGIKYWCFHDRDIAPSEDGKTLIELNKELDEVVDLAEKLQKETGIELLWGTANLFSNRKFMNGAATNPDPYVFAMAAAQVKKAMEVTNRLKGKNYVFWGGREGYSTLLNTNMKMELNHLAMFLKLAVQHKKEIGFQGTLLIEPKPCEPTSHQYDHDAATVIGFLKSNGLDKDFKLNIEHNHATLAGNSFEHELQTCIDNEMLGSIDANDPDHLLGWDVDRFPTDIRSATIACLLILKSGGLGNGGLNFDAKVRRESTDIDDLFIGHINGIDTWARGLRNASKIIQDGLMDQFLNERYSQWKIGIGREIENGNVSFADLEKFVQLKETNGGGFKLKSGQQERIESIFNSYL